MTTGKAQPLAKMLGFTVERVRSRLAFIEFGEPDEANLAELDELLCPHMEELVNCWHGFLKERPETRPMVEVAGHRLQKVQVSYFRTLLTGPRDDRYIEERLRVGLAHERVGLSPEWYTGSYRKFMRLVGEKLGALGLRPDDVAAKMLSLEKAVFLDMELALDAYFYAVNRQLTEANEELKRAASEVQEKNVSLAREFERAKQAAKIKDEFLSRISHELRTPLNSVLGFSDLLLDEIDGPLTADQGDSVKRIRDCGQKLLNHIDGLIDATRMSVAVGRDPAPFDPNGLVAQLAGSLADAAKAAGIEVEVDVESELPHVIGDEEAFPAAIWHVLDNSLKFGDHGKVTFQVVRRDGLVEFVVTDRGPGIPEEHRAKVFEMFHQVEFGDNRSVEGLGLGLPLAAHAMHKMGGRLTLVESGPRGSIFKGELPVANL